MGFGKKVVSATVETGKLLLRSCGLLPKKKTPTLISLSSVDYNQLGVTQYAQENYQAALPHFETAIRAGNSISIRNKGLFFEYGHPPIQKNFVTAAKLFGMAIKNGYARAEDDLNRLFQNEELTAIDLYNIGKMFYNGEEVSIDYNQSKRWLEKARIRGNAEACFVLGLMHESGNGYAGVRNFPNSAKYYQEAIERRCLAAQEKLDALCNNVNVPDDDKIKIGDMYLLGLGTQKNLQAADKWYAKITDDIKRRICRKKLFRIQFREERAASNFNLDAPDPSNNTRLHKAAQQVRLKDFARLLLLNADSSLRNAEIRRANEYLDAHQQAKVGRLQSQLNELISHLRESAPEILAGRLFLEGSFQTYQTRLEILRALYQVREIIPVMDLAKLAALALHNLSNRPKFTAINYDSDDDDVESIRDDQRLTIRVDARRGDVSRMYHEVSAEDFGSSWGLCVAASNTIFIAGQRNIPRQVRAVIAHELTHFAAQETFNNEHKPYVNNSANEARFTLIANELRGRLTTLDPILQQAFNLYQENKQHSELIVRVAQMIFEYDDGLDRLRAQSPALLEYYNDIFLVAVRNHINVLETRALSDWPKEMFIEATNPRFSFQRASP